MKAYATFDLYAADQSAKNRKIIAALDDPRGLLEGKAFAALLRQAAKGPGGATKRAR